MPITEATTLTRLDLDDLTTESSAVVYGKIVASRVEWDRNRTLLYTVYTVLAQEYFKSALGNPNRMHPRIPRAGPIGLHSTARKDANTSGCERHGEPPAARSRPSARSPERRRTYSR